MRAVNSSLFVPENATIESASELIEQNGIGAVAVVTGSGEDWLASSEGAGCERNRRKHRCLTRIFRDNPSGASVNCGFGRHHLRGPFPAIDLISRLV